jgi:O-glycosyl hydrolase
VLAVAVAARGAGTVTITLDPGATHQTMSGWECTTFVAEPCTPHYDAVRDAVLDRAVNDVGINRVRLEIRSGVENAIDHYRNWIDHGCPAPPDERYLEWRHNRYATVDDNADPGVIDWSGFHFTELDEAVERVVLPMRARLAARGERLFVNLCYVAFTGQIEGGSYHHDDADEYGEFVLATYLHMQDAHGFVPDTWEVVLEPDNVQQWNGTRLGEAIAAAAARLEAAGFAPRFAAPSNTSMSQIIAYFDDMVAVPGAARHLEMFSYHRYGANDATLALIVERAIERDLETGMLERCCTRT